MILSKKIEIRINSSNIKHYKELYSEINIGDVIIVDVNHLMKYSRNKILVKCDSCGIEKEISNKDYNSYNYTNAEYLCRKCKLKKNNIEKYGVENVFQLESVKNKTKNTNREKYGVEYITQSEEIRNKIKETNIKNYGCEHHLQNKDIINKQITTNLERYGVENISQLTEVKNKKIETCLSNNGYEYIFLDSTFRKCLEENNISKYGTTHSLQSDLVRNKIKTTNIDRYGDEIPSRNILIRDKIKNSVLKTLHENTLLNNKNIISINSDNRTFEVYCEHCNENFNIGYFLFYKRRETNTCICTKCNPIDKHQSGLEILLQKFIQDVYKDEILFNYRIDGKELDIYLPNNCLAFEFNGVYWHSEIFKDKDYHKQKTDICRNNGIQLFHIWEDDWLYRNEIIKSMIINRIGLTKNRIYARNCNVKELTDNCIIKPFLNNNHIQGFVGSNIKLGLYQGDNLVSLMCFKRNKDSYELNRFCNLLNTSVIGGASKLLTYFIKNYSNKVVTFSDNSYSTGDLYHKLNFKKIYDINPDYHYVENGLRVHKFNFRNKDTSELYRIYDAGKIKYILQ